jgi:hypothetical protein
MLMSNDTTSGSSVPTSTVTSLLLVQTLSHPPLPRTPASESRPGGRQLESVLVHHRGEIAAGWPACNSVRSAVSQLLGARLDAIASSIPAGSRGIRARPRGGRLRCRVGPGAPKSDGPFIGPRFFFKSPTAAVSVVGFQTT